MRASERGHEHIEGLIAADVLGGLDEADRRRLGRELAEHGPDCSECRRLLVDYGETAAHLAVALDPIPLSSEARASVMTRLRTASTRMAARGTVRRRIAAVAVAAALLAGAGVLGYALAPSRFVPTRVVSLSSGDQVLQVAYRPGDRDALIVGTHLTDPPPGKVYELWYQRADGSAMTPAGTFAPVNGVAASTVRLGPTFVLLAVSVEPRGGSSHPTTRPVFVAPV